MEPNVRKLVVGDSLSVSIKYVKASMYKVGANRLPLSSFSENPEDNTKVDIYLADGDSQILWKSVNKELILEIEYDVNFK